MTALTPRPAASARVPRWRVGASRAVSPRACLGGAGGPPGTQVGLLGPGCAAVPAPEGRAGQKIPAQYTLLTHTVRVAPRAPAPRARGRTRASMRADRPGAICADFRVYGGLRLQHT
eukprot:COSAG06_NODE_1745_length_8496_cov_3.733595_9_plen_117_part_00